MTLLTGSDGTREAVRNFVNLYVQADGTRGISCAPPACVPAWHACSPVHGMIRFKSAPRALLAAELQAFHDRVCTRLRGST